MYVRMYVDKWYDAFLNPDFLTRFLALLVISRPVGKAKRNLLSHLCCIFINIFLISSYGKGNVQPRTDHDGY
jgi:hypothetical protein